MQDPRLTQILAEIDTPQGRLWRVGTDDVVLRHAVQWFEALGETDPTWQASRDSWRSNVLFTTDPSHQEMDLGKIWNETVSALESECYELKHGLPAQRPKERFKYSVDERLAIAKLLRETIYPQISYMGEDQFKEIFKIDAMDALKEKRDYMRDTMQDIGLLRMYLSALCEDYSDKTGTKVTAHTASFFKSDLVKESKQEGEIGNMAVEILDVAKTLSERTRTLAKDFNTLVGKNLLEKSNITSIGVGR